MIIHSHMRCGNRCVHLLNEHQNECIMKDANSAIRKYLHSKSGLTSLLCPGTRETGHSNSTFTTQMLIQEVIGSNPEMVFSLPLYCLSLW
jgi:hypothetical protein